jgi:KDO2-lipid IV(A) lauroyltransferase
MSTAKNKEKKATIAHRAEYYSLRAMLQGLALLPWETACSIGERLGRLGHRPLGIRKDVVERQIAAAFPEWSRDKVLAIARASYAHLGRTAVEAALLPGLGENAVLDLVDRVDGWEHLEGALADGRGALGAAAHHGNWELLGAYLAARGVKVEVAVRGMGNPLFGEYINANRGRLGMTVMRDSEAVRRAARAIRDGRFVAFLSDQGVLGLASSFVPFFGRPAKTPRGFAVFALRLDVPVCFIDALRLPNGKFRVIIEPIVAERTGDREKDVDALVVQYSGILEKWVRAYPEQYFWQHRRWRRQPEGTPVELRDPTLEDPARWTPSR